MTSLIRLWLFVLTFVLCACAPQADAPYRIEEGTIVFAEPARAAGQQDVLQLRCDPIPVVRVAFVGLGMRGRHAVERFTQLEGVEVVALCDKVPAYVERAQRTLAVHGLPAALEFTGADDWRRVCELEQVDLIYNCTDWRMHVPIALYAMEQGKHVAVEVPAALTVADCWALVDTAERTRRHCMMLENCCYDFFEMATLNMARAGLFGEIVHVEGAYIHDLRSLQFDRRQGYVDMWRLRHNTEHTGNPYPTHGLGPLCQLLDIHRGDRMERLVSLSSDQFGMSAYAAAHDDASEQPAAPYALGDMNTTLIRTAKGRSILIQHDVTSPRPYNRLHTISGTKGFAQKYPIRSFAFDPDAHRRLSDEQADDLLRRYEHPIAREIGEKARAVGGHGGMDFIMDYRLVYCLRNGLPLDMDVYDLAEWCALSPLSEISIENGNAPVEYPDFTRGAWNKVSGFRHAFKDSAR